MPVFWSRTCTHSLHQIIEGSNNITSQAKHKVDYFLRQYSVDGCILRAAFHEQRYPYIFTSALRFRNKCQEVSVPTVSKNRVLGHDDRF